jgi:hypothetical protein
MPEYEGPQDSTVEDTMTDENRPPLEESPEVADAVEDDVAVSAFITGGGTDRDTPEFLQAGEEPHYRTGADQPWDPEDLAVAEGRDPTPENVERARQELERDGSAAIERTVP